MSETGVSPPESPKKGFTMGHKEKTVFSIVVALVAIGIAVNSSMQYEAHKKVDPIITHPPPTYTGSAPLAINTLQEARTSNNDFILVFTPSKDDALNTSVLNTAIAAGNKIRTTDGIFVGVFTLPKNDSLDYPTVFLRVMNRGDSSLYQITLREAITLDKIYDAYLARKFLRN